MGKLMDSVVGDELDFDKEFSLLEKYLEERVIMVKPMLLKNQMKILSKSGIWTTGYDSKNYLSFESWKKVNPYEPTIEEALAIVLKYEEEEIDKIKYPSLTIYR